MGRAGHEDTCRGPDYPQGVGRAFLAVLTSVVAGCGGSSLGADAGNVAIDAGGPGASTTLASSGLAVRHRRRQHARVLDGQHSLHGHEGPLGGGTPVTLASNQDNAWAIAVDATNVDRTLRPIRTVGAVMTVPLEGGTPVTFASGQMYPETLAVDGTHVYWTATGDGTVMKAPRGGGVPVTVASAQDSPYKVVVDATAVYWTNVGETGGPGRWEPDRS